MVRKQIVMILFFLLFVQMLVLGMGKAEPFTKKILGSFPFDDLKRAQFYVDSTLTLTRIVNGETVETIQISDKTGGELMTLNKGVLGICFAARNEDRREDRILYFTEELIGTEYFLSAGGSTVKYGQYEYKVNKKPKLMVQFTEPFTKKILGSFSFDDLKRAQFYVNSTLTLTRVVPLAQTKNAQEGTLSIVNGETVETILISNKTGGELMTLNRNVLGICFSARNEDRILYFTEELIGAEYFLSASGSTVKYGQYEYKVDKKPKLMVQFNENFYRKNTEEREEGRKVL